MFNRHQYKIVLLIIIVMSLFTVPAFAFYTRGQINADITYSNLGVYKSISGHYVLAAGTLENRTADEIDFDGIIQFVNIHGTLLNSGRVYKTLPPFGSVQFETYLERNNYDDIEHCYKAKWNFKKYSPEPEPKPEPEPEPEEKRGYSLVSVYNNIVKITGEGNNVSDQFYLESGRYKVKLTRKGKYNFRVLLYDTYGNSKYLAVDIGSGEGYKFFTLENSGKVWIDVMSDGNWNIDIEPFNPEPPPEEQRPAKKSSQKPASLNSGTGSFLVILKNGGEYRTDTIADLGDKIQVSIFGGKISFYKDDIKMIKTKNGQILDLKGKK